jgi:tetratricopeptide (TPR) repeat protein
MTNEHTNAQSSPPSVPPCPPAQRVVERLSPAWRLNYAQALAAKGDLDKAEAQVALAYAEKPDLKDGYARIGWQYYWQKKDYGKVKEWVEKDAGWTFRPSAPESEPPMTANPHESDRRAVIDVNKVNTLTNPARRPASVPPCPPAQRVVKRLSPTWLLNYAKALVKTDGIEAALPAVEEAYAADPKLKNGFASVAWQRYIPEDMAYEKVLPYFERDIEQGRLAGDWQLNYAQALAVNGRETEAEKVVEDAYAKDSSLKNGFARCGLQRHFLFYYEPEQAVKWFERDRERSLLSGQYHIHYAAALAAAGRLEEALAEVEQAYAEDTTVVNGYVLVGWYGHAVQLHQPEKALSLFEKDQFMGRIHSNANMLWAALYTLLGDRAIAESMIVERYETDASLDGGNTLLGLCHYTREKDLVYLNRMITLDERQGRLPRVFLQHIYATVCFAVGRIEDARLFHKRALCRTRLAVGYARSWLRRVGADDGMRMLEAGLRDLNDSDTQ